MSTFSKPHTTQPRQKQDKSEFHSAIDKSLTSRYHCQKCIGRGNYSFAYKLQNKRTRLPFCLKKIHDAFYCHTDAKNVFREVHVMNEIQKSSLGLKRKASAKRSTGVIYFTDGLVNRKDVYLVTPLFTCDLRSGMMILDTDDQKEWICFQIVWMLRELHDGARVMHRDLCPENIFMDDKCNITLGDLGLVRDYSKDVAKELPPRDASPMSSSDREQLRHDQQESASPRTDYVGHLFYRAPEIICGNPYYTEKVDIWSFGSICAELYVGTIFAGKNSLEQLKNILLFTGIPDLEQVESLSSPFAQAMIDTILDADPQFEKKSKEFRQSLLTQLPEQIADLVEKCLQFNAERRPTAEELMKHPLFEEHSPFDVYDFPTPSLNRIDFPENINEMEVSELKTLIEELISSKQERSVSPTKRGIRE
eukprot:CAMPEP_0117436842 /NCGR_PEP_ID=MMETSP0759-20121206/1215_1 /TAXON_ID=63605 /ORGANISM="Percolomonas cosmopolitus, Strain WS" /LENGTH=420 /DNA_ID=CAMNT_0005228453 /DNA_START=8 /DNA_END=1270 /DNA_ORIENTATION=+